MINVAQEEVVPKSMYK